MATHRRRRKTVSSSGRVFSQEIQRATWKKKKKKKKYSEDYDGRKIERERERSDKNSHGVGHSLHLTQR